MKKIMLLTAAVLAFAGCDPKVDPVTPVTPSSNDTYAIVAGVENGYAGKCDGCLLDAQRMKDIISPYAAKLTYLPDQKATRAAVAAALKEAVQHELCIFFYSGHGGSTPASSDKTETDGYDEFLCLYDGGMLDNEVWNIIKNSNGRVFLMFDCCHSATMYRAVKPFDFRDQLRKLAATSTVSGNISMICFSGCPDDTYSYGSSSGGELTNTFRKYFDKDLTYDQLWTKIEADKTLQKYEKVQRTLMGTKFGSKKIFQ